MSPEVDAAAAGAESARAERRLRVLRLIGRATRQLVLPPAPTRPRAVLLMRPDHLGDVLFATPAIRRLKAALPETHLGVLTGPWGRRILEGNHSVDSIVTWDIPWFNRRPSRGLLAPYGSALGLVGEVRRRGFDASVVLRFDFWWGALVAQLAGARRRVGYQVPEVEPFLTDALPYDRRHRHEVERNLALVDALLAALGMDIPPPARDQSRLEFHTTSSDQAEADGVLARHGLRSGERLLAIHAGAGSRLKWWSEEGFAVVADRLAERYGARIILTGQEAEAALVRSIERRATCAPVGVVGETSLGGLAALYGRCDCVVGSDSGPMHLAVAMGVPTVTLFGPADDRLFGPWGDPRRHTVVRTLVGCAPCGNLEVCTGRFGDRACMTRITPGMVMRAVERVLGDAPAS